MEFIGNLWTFVQILLPVGILFGMFIFNWFRNSGSDSRAEGIVEVNWKYSPQFRDLPEVKMQNSHKTDIKYVWRKTKKATKRPLATIIAEQTKVKSPPSFAELIIRFGLPVKYQDGILGDMHCEYHQIEAKHGTKIANVWFYWHAVWAVIANVGSNLPILRKTINK